MNSMAGYTKLFNSILASTVWSEPVETRIVWITLLAMADKDGLAEGSVPGLAVFARLSIEATRVALKRLSSPDPDSRSKEHDGRRIEAVEGGWKILNHAKYRAKLGADERREYNRKKQSEYRKRLSTNVNHSEQNVHIAEADTEAYITTPGLNLEVWKRWVAYRKDLKKPIRPASQEAAQKKLAAFGDLQAEVVEQSIANGWQGLFALNGAKNGTDNSAPGRVRAANGIKR